MTKIKVFLVIIFIAIGLVIRLVLLLSHYMFEWDQEDDAIKVMGIINTHKPRLIGPWIASENGFFVAPWHYYFLTPFYLVTQGDPIAGGYAAIAVWLIIALLTLIFVTKITGFRTGFMAMVLVSIQPWFFSWNVMYGPIFAITIFYLCFSYLQKPKILTFYLICATYGLAATTHLVPASLIVPIIFTLLISKHSLSLKNLIFGLLLVLIFISPLILFDFRHQFLNFNKIIEFITVGSDYGQSIFLRTFWRSLGLFNLPWINFERFFWLTVFIISPFLFKNIRHRLLVIVWLLTPLVVLSLYRGNIPEYYYSLSTSLLPIFLGLLIVRYKILIFIPLIFIYFTVTSIIDYPPGTDLVAKKNVVQYFKSNLNSQPFNVSYDFPIGYNNGYRYLFEYYQLTPQPDGPLYTIHPTSFDVSGTRIYQTNDGLAITKR